MLNDPVVQFQNELARGGKAVLKMYLTWATEPSRKTDEGENNAKRQEHFKWYIEKSWQRKNFSPTVFAFADDQNDNPRLYVTY